MQYYLFLCQVSHWPTHSEARQQMQYYLFLCQVSLNQLTRKQENKCSAIFFSVRFHWPTHSEARQQMLCSHSDSKVYVRWNFQKIDSKVLFCKNLQQDNFLQKNDSSVLFVQKLTAVIFCIKWQQSKCQVKFFAKLTAK